MNPRLRAGPALRVVLVLVLTLAGLAPAGATPPVRVMVLGTLHFDNPGLDDRNVKVDDVLAPARQREVADVVASLARFRPTLVGVEWRDPPAQADYARYRAGTLAPTRDEGVQLGFRLASVAGARLRGLDTPMQLPFDPVFDYAKSHELQGIVDEIGRVGDANVAAQERMLRTRGIAATLRLLNDPVAAMRTHGLYREVLRIGGGAEQPGVEATLAWYRRNLSICANLLQAARPGDRVVLMFGAGHLPLLRQCVQETPGYELVDPRGYLPQG